MPQADAVFDDDVVEIRRDAQQHFADDVDHGDSVIADIYRVVGTVEIKETCLK